MNTMDFNKFLSARSAGIMEEQTKRIKENFDSSLPIEDYTAEIIAECHVCTVEYLKAYHNWLTENFDIKPKSN